MPNNMVLLETIALTQSAASVTFDNLPTSGYTDLKIVASTRWSNTGPDGFYISFNGSTASFTSKVIEGSGSAASSASPARLVGGLEGTGYTANTFGSSEIYIPNYRSSNYKSYSADAVTENNATQAFSQLIAGLWSSVDAITSIGLAPTSGSFVAESTFSLYGIAAYGTTPTFAPKASGGNIIENDGTYWIHTFTSSGSFIPQQNLTCDYLVVAGGGGGSSGGGGAGGYRTSVGTSGGNSSPESTVSVVNNTTYAVTVGAGGASAAVASNATVGGTSTFSTITSNGGGGGGGINQAPASGTYGSGAGGGSDSTNSRAGSAGTTGQGFAGGLNSTNRGAPFPAGAGGGAGALGGDGSGTTVGGTGGNGIASTITGSSVTRAGGGGGGVYAGGGSGGGAGTGGGGAANVGNNGNGAAGTANTGGGGGGAGASYSGGTGGSGIVIIRYPIAS